MEFFLNSFPTKQARLSVDNQHFFVVAASRPHMFLFLQGIFHTVSFYEEQDFVGRRCIGYDDE